MYYIPQRVVLPFGYTIRIKQLRLKKWRAAYEDVFKDKGWKDCAAFFHETEDGAVILLQRNRTPHQRKEDLVHELQHAMVEYGEYVKNLSPLTLAP